MNQTRPFPLPSDFSRSSRSNPTLVRAVASFVEAHFEKNFPGNVARERWPDDKAVAAFIVRSTVAITDTTTSTNAAQLVSTATADFAGTSLRPSSAIAAAFPHGLQVQFKRNGAINIPGISPSAAGAGFAGEGAPIRVIKLAVDGITLLPKKFASIIPFTHEFYSRARENVEVLFGAAVSDCVGLALDSAALDANAADETRPAGLRYGIDAKTASSATSKAEAMADDIITLASSVAPVAGNGEILLIASPAQAVALKMRRTSATPFEIFSSAGLEDGTVCAIAARALVSGIGDAPRIDTSTETTIHSDTSPLAIAGGSPPVHAAPIFSAYQQDLVVLKLVLPVSWGLRSATGLAWTQSVVW